MLSYQYRNPIINTLRPRQNGRHFPDDIFKCIFLDENAWISITISLKFVPKGPINKIPKLVQIMAWRRSGDKPLSETMMVSLLTHICVTRTQWVKIRRSHRNLHIWKDRIHIEIGSQSLEQWYWQLSLHEGSGSTEWVESKSLKSSKTHHGFSFSKKNRHEHFRSG